ncbi:MAG: DNA ligase D, partial [Ferruginibacter sp.]
YVFDLLSLNAKDTTSLPLIERKVLLKKLIRKNPIIKYSDHIIGNGKEFYAVAEKQDLEGIMAKKADSVYFPGVRTGDWLKIKQHHSDEVIITGFTEPTGSRKYFGALVLATKKGNQLKYAGHTGTGFNDKMIKEIYEKLKPLIRPTSVFTERVKTNTAVTWVEPKYIAEIKFTEWTSDGKMRHPVFLRMREDKKLKDIQMATITKSKTLDKTKSKVKSKKVNQEDDVENDDPNEKDVIIGKNKVHLTNQHKIYWPDEKITKGMMIDYYQQVADYILPYLKDRPESLKRNPSGINGIAFYHKDAGDDAPSWVKSKKIFSDSVNKDIDYIICNDKATLAYLNNLGCIELNPWNSTTKALDKPDYMIIDIDPAPKNTFEQVIETANVVKAILDKAGASSYCKTSGATGLHIFVPMQKKYDYETVKNFAHIICVMANEQLPSFTSIERNLKKRGSKIYLDFLQNRRGQTISSVYSLRPRAGATVSTPLLWKEVKSGLSPSMFTIETILPRLKKMKDIFSPVLGKGIDLQKCLAKLQ